MYVVYVYFAYKTYIVKLNVLMPDVAKKLSVKIRAKAQQQTSTHMAEKQTLDFCLFFIFLILKKHT